ncbi:hypothetical protein CCDG5_1256 [[Clostridium] cellulosi]|jgi:hypothetical protein|uniref:Starch-binding module 26 domain-containing protein n=2 Tax=Bacteria TaxID=2 RepID=A0A078KT89_9FIRM|nr:hypothetical protein CCDG5_1256 [[Clostridium] cellulosi]
MISFKKLIAGIISFAVMLTSAIAIALPASAASKTVTIYFKNTQNWNTVYAYIWAGSGPVKGTPAWPGQKMTKVSGTDDWYEIKYTGGTAFNVIFNDNAQPKPNQTSDHTPKDLSPNKSAYWFVPSGKTETNSNGLTPAGTSVTVYSDPQAGFPTPSTESTTSKSESSSKSSSSSSNVSSPNTGDASESTLITAATAALIALAGVVTVLVRKKARE